MGVKLPAPVVVTCFFSLYFLGHFCMPNELVYSLVSFSLRNDLIACLSHQLLTTVFATYGGRGSH